MPASPVLMPRSSLSMKKSASCHAILRATCPPLDKYYNCLDAALGPQHWWPGDTPFEVIIGAILTPLGRLARLVRPSGYFRQKAKKLKAFVCFLRREFNGSLERMFQTPTAELREKLLRVFGIGPETADSILLYAGGMRSL